MVKDLFGIFLLLGTLLSVTSAHSFDCKNGEYILDVSNSSGLIGCYKEKDDLKYDEVVKMCLTEHNGFFDLRAIKTLLNNNTQQSLIRHPGHRYFVDGTKKDGKWIDSRGHRITSFPLFPTFDGHDCHDGSHLVWTPTEIKASNYYGKLSCEKEDEEARGFCVRYLPRCTTGRITKTSGRKACYFFGKDNINFYQGQAYCELYGAQLPEPKSSGEDLFVVGLKPATGPMWLGANDNAVEGKYVYLSDGQPLSFSNWNAGEPNNSGGIENCLERSNNGWNDVACTQTTGFHTFCEFIY